MVSSVCSICGTANPAQAAFCFACGKSLQQTTQASAPTSAGTVRAAALVRQRYRILMQVGKGGFGVVYKAADTKLGDRVVALKEMSESGLNMQEAAEATENFKREALLLAGLTHPNLPRIYDHFFDVGHWYLVMDFIEGETLEDMLDKAGGKLPVEKVLAIGMQLCSVLNYLHTRQPPVIFRDLKPANILLTADNNLYLIDFGIARLFKPGQAKDTIAFGSPGYAAPEQYGKAQTTPRSDIYSLGATLHEMLTGDDPSDMPFSFAPLRIAAPALEQLIMRMVSMDVSKRPMSIAEIQQELQNIANGNVGMPLAVASLAYAPYPPTYGSIPLHVTAGELLSKYRNHTGEICSVAWSPDSKYIASASEDKTVQVWEAATGKTFLLCSGHTALINAVAWSPDGMHIASVSNDKMTRVWNAQSGLPILIFDGNTGWHAGGVNAVAWSPDGIHIATGGHDKAVKIWNAISGKRKLVYRGHHNIVRALSWSPDSSCIVSGSDSSLRNEATINTWDTNTGETLLPFPVSNRNSSTLALAWSPDGNHIASSSSNWETAIWNVDTDDPPLLYLGHTGAVQTVAWSPDSQYIASGGADATVQIWNPLTGDTLYTYHGHTATAWNVTPDVRTVAWSPDGQYIASGGSDNTVVQVWRAR
ncbi:MAG: WD40 repeat domain-containing serine/threonine-protein kinase [Ktedonobacteraceae bacterium]